MSLAHLRYFSSPLIKKCFLIFLFTFLPTPGSAAEEIDVLIKGIDDGIKTTAQKDYQEALMNAKLQAIERAGVEIRSITRVENYQLKYDLIESRAQAVLLPGFQVLDLGYQPDGTYQVVLSGKVRTSAGKKALLRITFEGIALERKGQVPEKPESEEPLAWSVQRAISPVKFFLKEDSPPSGRAAPAEVVHELRYELYSYEGDHWCGEEGVPSKDERRKGLKKYCPEHLKKEKIPCWWVCTDDSEKKNLENWRKKLATTFEIEVTVGKKYTLWAATGDPELYDRYERYLISIPVKISIANENPLPLVFPFAKLKKLIESDDPVLRERSLISHNIRLSAMTPAEIANFAKQGTIVDDVYFEVKPPLLDPQMFY